MKLDNSGWFDIPILKIGGSNPSGRAMPKSLVFTGVSAFFFCQKEGVKQGRFHTFGVYLGFIAPKIGKKAYKNSEDRTG